MIKAVIFDLDNTLLDRTTTFGNFTRSFLRNYMSHATESQQLFDLIVKLDEDGYKDKPELFAELLERLPWQSKPQLAELIDYYSAEYVKSAVLMEQSREVIAYAGSKYRLGMITNGRTHIQYGKIDQLGIRDPFELILVSEEAGLRKPDPRIFEPLHAIERLGQLFDLI
jgi:putative hydrolase of the HAD superfamily